MSSVLGSKSFEADIRRIKVALGLSSYGGGTDILIYEDQQTSGTHGGTFTQDAWQTRVLNTEVADAGGHGTLASNQVTLVAGIYRLWASAPAYVVKRHQCRIYDTTNTAVLATGASSYTHNTVSNMDCSVAVGRFTLAAQAVIELQHYCEATRATNGFGIACNFGTEVYAQLILWKEQ